MNLYLIIQILRIAIHYHKPKNLLMKHEVENYDNTTPKGHHNLHDFPMHYFNFRFEGRQY